MLIYFTTSLTYIRLLSKYTIQGSQISVIVPLLSRFLDSSYHHPPPVFLLVLLHHRVSSTHINRGGFGVGRSIQIPTLEVCSTYSWLKKVPLQLGPLLSVRENLPDQTSLQSETKFDTLLLFVLKSLSPYFIYTSLLSHSFRSPTAIGINVRRDLGSGT